MIIIYDFETVNTNKEGVDPNSCHLVQVAAIPLDDKRLELLEDESFNLIIKPPVLEDKTFQKDYSNVIEFHCEAQKLSKEDLLERWKQATPQSEALTQFVDYVKGIGGKFSGGHNIKSYDNVILKRLCGVSKKRYPFNYRDEFDLLDYAVHWFKYSKNPPKNYKLETLCEFFGMDTKGSHDALVDVKNCGQLLLRFLKLHKTILHNTNWSAAAILNGEK